jgi:hypothetical protein
LGLGIASLLFSLTPLFFLGLLLGIAAIVLGLISRRPSMVPPERPPMAKAGLICGGIGVGLSILAGILAFTLLASWFGYFLGRADEIQEVVSTKEEQIRQNEVDSIIEAVARTEKDLIDVSGQREETKTPAASPSLLSPSPCGANEDPDFCKRRQEQELAFEADRQRNEQEVRGQAEQDKSRGDLIFALGRTSIDYRQIADQLRQSATLTVPRNIREELATELDQAGSAVDNAKQCLESQRPGTGTCSADDELALAIRQAEEASTVARKLFPYGSREPDEFEELFS